MTANPREGVDEDGFIVSGADPQLIPAVYLPVLESCVTTLRAHVQDLVAVYLYGSVATGQARSPASDIDLLVLLPNGERRDAVDTAAAELSLRYRQVTREISVGIATHDGIWADDLDGLGGRCFVKHYCIPLHGEDIRPLLPRFRASAQMAWAFNHNVSIAVEHARQRVELADTSPDVEELCRVAARKVMLAAASLASVVGSTWTTDRSRAADIIAERYPQWAADAAAALEWCSSPTDDRAAVRAFLEGFATWVADELARQAAPR